jgi:hypothetical protein
MILGLRRAELVGLGAEDFQVREEHWVIPDLIGKGKHIPTVPVPAWRNAPSMSGSWRLARPLSLAIAKTRAAKSHRRDRQIRRPK